MTRPALEPGTDPRGHAAVTGLLPVVLAGAGISVAWLRRGVADVIPPAAGSGAGA